MSGGKKQYYLDVSRTIESECDPKNVKYQDSMSTPEILTVTPMSYLEEATAVFLFVFGVPGAVYSVSYSTPVCPCAYMSVSGTFELVLYSLMGSPCICIDSCGISSSWLVFRSSGVYGGYRYSGATSSWTYRRPKQPYSIRGLACTPNREVFFI